MYKGGWKENKKSGKGVFIWPDGKRYDGSYENDKKNGFGVLSWYCFIVLLSGLMGGFMKVSGRMRNNMVQGSISTLTVL